MMRQGTITTFRRESLFYDNAGRITRQVFHDRRVVLFDYDANGNLIETTQNSNH